MTACRIGVMAEAVQQLGELTRLVRGAGFSVTAALEATTDLTRLPEVDVWVVNLDLHQPQALALVEALDAKGTQVIFDHDLQPATNAKNSAEKPPSLVELRLQRERRLAQKLRQWVAPGALRRKRAKEVWVLAASTGGVEAVMVFLQQLPAELAGVAFIYAQHIEPSGFSHLLKAVQKNCRWPVVEVDRAHTVYEQSVFVVSPNQQVELADSGTISPSAKPWDGKFKPSLNQVIAKVARVYKARGGAIVFSGMGDDGADSCHLLRHRGGQIWVQSPATCAVDSMPKSVAAKGPVHVEAAPADLARRFVKYQKYGQTS